MSDLVPFNFEEHHVRVEMIDGDPWFHARDVGECLGLSASAVRTAATALPAGEFKAVRLTDSLHGQKVTFLSERGIYLLIMRSRKPAAEPFQLWIATEVLPAIRETGRYELEPMEPAELMSRALVLDHETIARAEQRARAAEETLEIQEPVVRWAEDVMDSDTVFSVKDAVKQFGGGQKLTEEPWAMLTSAQGPFYRNDRGWRVWRVKTAFAKLGHDQLVTVGKGNAKKTVSAPRFTFTGGMWLGELIKKWQRQGTIKALPRRAGGVRQGRLREGMVSR